MGNDLHCFTTPHRAFYGQFRSVLSDDSGNSIIVRFAGSDDGPKRGGRRKTDLGHGKRNRQQQCPVELDDNVALSAVAHISFLEDEGLSVAVIAAELGLTAEEVLADARIAAEISHPNGLAPQTQSDEC